jgi:hypothetical protein
MKSTEEFRLDFETRGWSRFDEVLSAEFTARLRADCLLWIGHCNRLQVDGGINEAGDNTAHHTLGRRDSLDEFLDTLPLTPYLEAYFSGGPYVLHAFNPVGGAPHAKIYLHKIHRDARTFFPGFNFMLNMLVLLDDFRPENGATQFLEGSHRLRDRPDEAYFDRHQRTLVAPGGTIVLFNSYLWHRGGFNATTRSRVALTLSFSPPFVKPQLDYARMLGPSYAAAVKPQTRQLLGYDAMTPVSLQEWYQPAATRLFKSNQI